MVRLLKYFKLSLLFVLATTFTLTASAEDKGGFEENLTNNIGSLKVEAIPINKQSVKTDINKTIASYSTLYELLERIKEENFHTKDSAESKLFNNTRSEAGRRLADLKLESSNEIEFGDTPPELTTEPAHNLKTTTEYKPITAIYEQMLLKNPAFKSNDRILYQLAHIYELMGKTEKMVSSLSKLVDKYKNSRFYVEANFRLAERYFVTKDYESAATHYGIVFREGKSSSFFDQTIYKYGWALFKLQEVHDAMKKFILLLDRLLMGATDTTMIDKSSSKSLFYDVLHIVGYSFAHMGGPKGINTYFEENGHRGYEHLIYNDLAEHYEEKERIGDAAKSYLAFVELYPAHEKSPGMQIKAIDIYEKGGFPSTATKEKEAFVERYKFDSPLWENMSEKGKTQLTPHLQKHLIDLSEHYHAMSQKNLNKKETAQQAQQAFDKSLYWYKRYLISFPKAANSGHINFMMAELLFDFKHYATAIDSYLIAAYESPTHKNSAEAGYGALIAYTNEEKRLSSKEERDAWQALEIKNALRFSDTFQADPRRPEVLTKVSEQLFHNNQYEQAAKAAKQIITLNLATDARMLQTAKQVYAHSSFELHDFSQAESAYIELLKLTKNKDKQDQKLIERLAASIYKQGEVDRTQGRHYAAAQHFQRIGKVASSSTIKETADYDAANSYLEAEAWAEASAALDLYIQNHPKSPALDEIHKKQVLAYLQDGQQLKAAKIYTIISQHDQNRETRLEASWNAAEIYFNLDQQKSAIAALKNYIKLFPTPFEQAVEARQQLVHLYEKRGNIKKRDFWLKQIIKVEKTATGSQSERIHFLAAKASLILAEPLFNAFNNVQLKIPLQKSLRSKKQKMKAAIKAYKTVAKYQVAKFTTAATYHTAEIYRQLGLALMESEHPKNLNEEELEQYEILLEEQAYPFEERAIETHQANIETVLQGIYNKWNRLSFTALAKLQPVRYDKQEKSETLIHALQ
jgi:tetratricopeptide (TPR) repeat protein